MISPENPLFTAIATAIRAQYPNAYVSGEYFSVPSQFPAVCIEEIDNSPYKRSATNQTVEHQAVVTYEVNVYSNRVSGKKAECNAIAEIIDAWMRNHQFFRRMKHPIQNMNDATIYRLTMRYEGKVGADGNNYIVYR